MENQGRIGNHRGDDPAGEIVRPFQWHRRQAQQMEKAVVAMVAVAGVGSARVALMGDRAGCGLIMRLAVKIGGQCQAVPLDRNQQPANEEATKHGGP